nr:CotS family spore coat protein [Paenibacillus baekrokdamisoli]
MVVENYQIVPWIDDVLSPEVVHNMYVPPEMETMARQVMELYDMQVFEMVLITSKPDKGGAIWKIGTNHGNRSIKVLHRRPQRSLFSIGAQDYMAGIEARVPSFIPTKDGNLYVEAGGKMWIVTEWIEPLLPVSKIDLEGASSLCYGLGEFHKNSKGYVPPFGSEVSSRLYSWPKYYEKIIAKIGWFRDIATAYPEFTASTRLLAVIDDFEKQANEIYGRFMQSSYSKLLSKGEAHWGLAHQDYGWSNGQMGPGGIWVIDLDGVSYDLPIRDLRKLMTSTMDDMGAWDITWIRGMIDAYHQANPLDQETFEILWLDMAFPNEFYKHVKEIVFEPIPFFQTELEPILQRVLATETSKWQVLNELEKDKFNYPAGDYTMEEPEALFEFGRPERALQGDSLLLPQDDFWTQPIASDDPSAAQPELAPILENDPLIMQPELIPAFSEIELEYIEDRRVETTLDSEAFVLIPNTPEPGIALPAIVTQDPAPAALFHFPAPAPTPTKFTLRIPKRSSKAKGIKKTVKPKRKYRKRILKSKTGTMIKTGRKLKKPLLKKVTRPIFKFKKKSVKRIKGKRSKNITQPLKKQLRPRQKTA